MYDVTTRLFPHLHTLQMEWLKIAPIDLHLISYQFEHVGDPWQMRRGPTGRDR